MAAVDEPFYPITAHLLLSAAAAALAPDMLAAVTVASERIHELRTAEFSGEEAETAKLVNVYQVNRWLADGAVTVGSNVASIGRGARSISYVVQTNGRASELRDTLGSWPIIRTRR
jgi:hypothetical protein